MEELMGRPSLRKGMARLNLQERTEGLNLVLLGKIGAGKSASGNTILGREAFQSRKSFSSITQDVAVASGIVCGRRVTVYDTPGLFHTKISEQEIQQMINEKVLQRCESGPCVFLLVIKADRFTGKEREAVEKIEELLGEERLKKTWILFTRGDELEKENKSIDEFVNETKALKRLVQKYDQRYHVFSNNKKREPNGQVQELLTKIHATHPDRIKKEAKPKQERLVKTRRQLFSRPVAQTEDLSSWYSQSLGFNSLGKQGLMRKPSSYLWNPMEESSSTSEDEVTAQKLGYIPDSVQKSRRHGPVFVSGGPVQHFYAFEPDSPESCEITPGCFFTRSNACDYTPRRIVLLGKTGVGKSASGNTILGQREFISEMSMSSVTSECSAAHATVSGRSVSVVDTPGLYHTALKTQQLMTEIARSIYISSPGPHAFLIVFPVNMRFIEHDQQIPQMIEMMFGEEVLKYSIILFTHGDQLRGEFVEKIIVKNSRLRDLVDQCGGRFHVFNNRDENNRDQVNDLLKMIDTMIEENGGGHYSNQMIEDPLRFRHKERERKQQEKQRQEEIERNETEERIKLKCPSTFRLVRPYSSRPREKDRMWREEQLEELDIW